MSKRPIECSPSSEQGNGRSRLRRAALLTLLLGSILATTRPILARIGQGERSSSSRGADEDAKRAVSSVQQTTMRPIRTVLSEHFRAIGDASESFMKITLGDCERFAPGYFDHFRAKGFEVHDPDRRLTLIVFADESSFRGFVKGSPKWALGLYKRSDNWLVLFDFRSVTSQKLPRGYQANMWTLAHEATHLLAYNTGLLSRQGDVPRAISEGIATYGEARTFDRHSEPGQVNSTRLRDLAYIQRSIKWINVKELLADEKAAFGPTEARVGLAYAESWLLVYYLMSTPSRLPQFRAYLKSIYKRRDASHRLQDAESNFGSLDQLDRELRQEGIRLQQRQ
jgi:hypothetical protein